MAKREPLEENEAFWARISAEGNPIVSEQIEWMERTISRAEAHRTYLSSARTLLFASIFVHLSGAAASSASERGMSAILEWYRQGRWEESVWDPIWAGEFFFAAYCASRFLGESDDVSILSRSAEAFVSGGWIDSSRENWALHSKLLWTLVVVEEVDELLLRLIGAGVDPRHLNLSKPSEVRNERVAVASTWRLQNGEPEFAEMARFGLRSTLRKLVRWQSGTGDYSPVFHGIRWALAYNKLFVGVSEFRTLLSWLRSPDVEFPG